MSNQSCGCSGGPKLIFACSVKSSLEQAGLNTFRHLQLADLGLEKCRSPVTEESVNKVAARATEMIGS